MPLCDHRRIKVLLILLPFSGHSPAARAESYHCLIISCLTHPSEFLNSLSQGHVIMGTPHLAGEGVVQRTCLDLVVSGHKLETMTFRVLGFSSFVHWNFYWTGFYFAWQGRWLFHDFRKQGLARLKNLFPPSKGRRNE